MCSRTSERRQKGGRITDADGTVHELVPGVVMVLPLGWSGRWDITETLRKLYVTLES